MCVCVCLTGPVDAAYKAIDTLVMVEAELTDYTVNSVTEGIEALATTRVIIRPAGKLSDQAVTMHATKGKVQRSFSGARAELPVCVCVCVCACIVMCNLCQLVGP